MLAAFSMIFGFFSSFLPKLIEYFEKKQAFQQELLMMELRLKYAEKEHMWRLEEINAKADIAEAEMLHKPAPSFGVQMLDAAKNSQFGKWAIVPAFYMFAILDWVSGMVRPTVTFMFVGFYLLYKYSQFQLMQSVSDLTTTWWDNIFRLWSENDLAILLLVLSYYFGQRAYKSVFGGNASTGKPGG